MYWSTQTEVLLKIFSGVLLLHVETESQIVVTGLEAILPAPPPPPPAPPDMKVRP